MNMTSDAKALLEQHRETSGRFGSHQYSASDTVVLTAPAGPDGFCSECGEPAGRYTLCMYCDPEVHESDLYFPEEPPAAEVYEDPCPGKAGTDTQWVDCKRCSGEGTMSQFKEVYGGECFDCRGTKGAHTPVSVIRRRAREQVSRNNAAAAKLHARRMRHNSNVRRAVEMNPSAEGWLKAMNEDTYLSNMWENAFAWDLSDKQLATVGAHFDRKAARAAAKEAEKAAAVEVPEGKYELTGEVVSLEFKDNQYGYGQVAKMTVKDERGFKVYGTAPASLLDEGELEGKKISFTATVSKGREKGFGFFSRPSKARNAAA